VFDFPDRMSSEFLDFDVLGEPIPRYSTSDMPPPRLRDEELRVYDPESDQIDEAGLMDEHDPMRYYWVNGLHAEVIGSRVIESLGIECPLEKRSPDSN
jgi:hypothetical protein